jgi:putative FmdB family regulatory protein
MPHCVFSCHNCKKPFSEILALVDCEEGKVLCPHCGSKEVEQRLSGLLHHQLQKVRVT